MYFNLFRHIILMMLFPLFSNLLMANGLLEKKYCVIVDAYSSGKYYAPYFKDKGYSCIHIQTNPNLPYEILLEDFELLIPYQGDIQEVLNSLKTYPIDFIVPGSEPGVEFAEELSLALNLFLNEPGSGEKCRNKFLTGETLQNNGIRSIKQVKITNPKQAIEWLKLHDCFPVVVKPSEGGLIFETYSLVEPSECPQSKEMFDYAFTVLDTLGIKYGPAHIEIVLTKKGPVLMECNGRPHGHHFPEALMLECLGQTQIELSTLALMNPEEFFRRIEEPFHIYNHMTVVELIALEEGEIEAIQFLDEIEKLPSFHQFRTHYKPGDYMNKTIDLSTSPGDIFLKCKNRDQIREDVRKIRKLEAEGLFKIVKEVT